LVVLGSNGEFPFLKPEEKFQLVKLAKQNMSPEKLLIVGAGCEGTRMTVELCEQFEKLGANAVLVHTPHFFKSLMNDAALENHFNKVADLSPLPVILYSVPSNTGIDLQYNIVVKLSSHPNIIGLKDSGGDVEKMAKIVEATKSNNFQVLAGSAHFLMDAIKGGCVGGVCAVANILGQDTVDLANLCFNKKFDEAEKLQARLTPPNLAVTRKFGVPALKYMMDKFGYYGGPLRNPLQPLSEETKRLVEHEFTNSGFKF